MTDIISLKSINVMSVYNSVYNYSLDFLKNTDFKGKMLIFNKNELCDMVVKRFFKLIVSYDGYGNYISIDTELETCDNVLFVFLVKGKALSALEHGYYNLGGY